MVPRSVEYTVSKVRLQGSPFLKRIILALIWLIGIVTAIRLASGLWERYHTEPRVDIKGKTELSLIERAHVARYEFAKQFCSGKTVADIASGAGFGMDILRTVAKSVDGYDLEPLGQQFIIDLEKQAWSRHYDVVVSFETIEHLSNPEFFLGNVRNTSRRLILSAPLNERKGWTNPYHKQVWTDSSIKRLLEKFFTCEYYYQYDTYIDRKPNERLIIAVCAI